MDNSTLAAKSDIKRESRPFRDMNKSEPEWLYELRKNGWDFYQASPLPERSNHLWRYSDPQVFDPLVSEPERGFSQKAAYSQFKTESISTELTKKGVIFKDLLSASVDNRKLIEKYLGEIVDVDFGKFEALNHAMWNAGLFLYIPDNVEISRPIHIRYSPSSENEFRRLLIVAGKNVDVSIIDDYLSGGKYCLVNSVFEIFAGDDSRIRLLNLNRFSDSEKAYITGRTRIGANSSIDSVYACFSGGDAKVNTGVILNGKGSSSRMTGLISGDKKRISDYHTRHHHVSGDSYSNLNFKVAVKDNSQSAYTGLIRIEKEAANCEAYQVNNNLILDKGAKAESIPELEILTDQVKCSHGATMGPVDPDMLFFMRSRGLSEHTAIELIIKGFFESAMAEIPETFKEILKDELTLKLKAG